jgi:hypothetical protein
MYRTVHFELKELANPKIIADIGEINTWMRFKEGALRDLDLIRDSWGSSILINTKTHDSRGWRHPNDPDGAKWSVHKLADAFDLVAGNGKHRLLWDHVYYMILTGQLMHFNTMEDVKYTKTWTHVANMNTFDRPLIIRP